MKQEIRSERIRESYQKMDHPSGLTLLLYPMEGFSSAYAMLTTDYGSVDMAFRTDPKADFTRIPAGTAHFLEHKMFENEDGDAFAKYAATGARPMRLPLLIKPPTCSAARTILKSRCAFCWSLSLLLILRRRR